MFEENDDVESENESVIENKKVDEANDESEIDEESIRDSDVEDDDEEDEEEGDEEDAQMAEKQASAFIEPDDDDDEEDEDVDYLQKFDESIKQKIITDFHPELKTHNYDEIEVMSRVVRDNNGIVIDPLHKTLPFITKYEKSRILGERATQLNAGAQPMIETEPDMIDGYIIAMKEFEQKKIPFIIKRPLPNGAVEYWKLEDLEVI
jgi:DNA-directed RNA polymerase subunit K/omega